MKAKTKRIVVNIEAFVHIMASESAWKVHKGVPRGSRIRGAVLDPYTQNINIFLEHDSFEEIDIQNQVAPILETEFRKI